MFEKLKRNLAERSTPTMDLTRVYFDSAAIRYWENIYAMVPSNHHALLLQKRRAAVINLVAETQGKTLELGCGPGVFVADLPKSRPYVVADLSDEMVRLAISRGKGRLSGAVQLSAERLPFSANSFDLVTAVGLLEYLPEIRTSLAEIFRVLRCNGVAVISFPSPQPWGNMLRLLGRPVEPVMRAVMACSLTPEDRMRRELCHRTYWRYQIKKVVSSVGFTVDKRLSFHYFYFPFDKVLFKASKKVNCVMERFALSAPFVHVLAQTHLWRLRKLL